MASGALSEMMWKRPVKENQLVAEWDAETEVPYIYL